MKKLRKVIISAAMCLTTFGMSSCEKENISTSKDQTAGKELSADLALDLGPTYTLIRCGNDSLFYYPNGKLMKVKLTHNFFYEYIYSTPDQNGNSTIKITTYKNGNVWTNFQYDLDKNGHCVLFYDYSGSKDGWQLVYEYSADGRLKKGYAPGFSNGTRSEYVYDANGDLIRVEQYQGDMNNAKKMYEIIFEYTSSADRYRLNYPFYFDTKKVYLPIFGKFNKHLPRKRMFRDVLANHIIETTLFYYQLDSRGYVTEKWEVTDGIWSRAEPYRYQVELTRQTQ